MTSENADIIMTAEDEDTRMTLEDTDAEIIMTFENVDIRMASEGTDARMTSKNEDIRMIPEDAEFRRITEDAIRELKGSRISVVRATDSVTEVKDWAEALEANNNVTPTLERRRARLLRHIIQSDTGLPQPRVLFLVEKMPYELGSSGRKSVPCHLFCCPEKIHRDIYRIVVRRPRSAQAAKGPKTCIVEKYHVRCFETLVDISEPIYLERIIPGTRHTISLRDLDPKNVLAQNACLDGGAEALVMQWKLLMSEPLKRGDNLEAPKPVPLNANLDALHRADANLPILNPIQRLNDEDTHEWNLFTRYIPSDLRSNRHSLSDILRNWQYSVFLANADYEDLDEKEKQDKSGLGARAISAIGRLSQTPAPNLV